MIVGSYGTLWIKANIRTRPRYAEKIVQQEIDLPKPSRNALLSILDQQISFITGGTETSEPWQYIVRDGVSRWIRSPRDVVRLSNALKFSWPAMEGEVDPPRSPAIEGLRLFDAGAFAWIKDNRDFLFHQGRFVLSTDEIKQDAVEVLKRRIPKDLHSQVLRLCSVLFPQSTQWFESSKSLGGSHILK